MGKLPAEELTAAIQIPADLVEPNVYDLKLTPANPADSYRVVEYRPKQVRVRIDRLEHKAFDVVPIVSGVSTPAGYILEEEPVAPKQIVVQAPRRRWRRSRAAWSNTI